MTKPAIGILAFLILKFPFKAPSFDILDNPDEILAAFCQRILTLNGDCGIIDILLNKALLFQFFKPCGQGFGSNILQFAFQFIKTLFFVLALVEFEENTQGPFFPYDVHRFINSTVFHDI